MRKRVVRVEDTWLGRCPLPLDLLTVPPTLNLDGYFVQPQEGSAILLGIGGQILSKVSYLPTNPLCFDLGLRIQQLIPSRLQTGRQVLGSPVLDLQVLGEVFPFDTECLQGLRRSCRHGSWLGIVAYGKLRVPAVRRHASCVCPSSARMGLW